jgi:phenylalanyl-tRNA synthetase beta chain
MRLLVSWLREFVDVPASADEIAATLGVRGFEVASVEPVGSDGDAVIDFEITANRPDCLSVIGLAREVATAYQLPLAWPEAQRLHQLPIARRDERTRLAVTNEAPDLCPRYSAAVAEMTPTQSPDWLTTRLQAAGVRPISPIVDVTNYVNIELGQPMHAFDLAALAGGEIRIRRARPGETIRTLDAAERRLDPEMLVIADASRAQAIAGVMGGGDSEVSAATTAIVFESACFKPASVRRTSKRLQLKTEASTRFERGCDPNATVLAIQRAVALMEQIGAGRPSGPVIDCYPTLREPQRVRLRTQRLSSLLGVAPADAEVERILQSLGMTISRTAEGWDVTAPTYRVDLLREADLIEEVGRHYGFEKLESTFPVIRAPMTAPDPRIARDRLARRVLTAAGISEAVTFGFIDAKAADAFASAGAAPPVGIANPLNAKFDTLRPSLIPGLVDALAHNRRHGIRDARLFEIGARFATSGETRALAVAWTGNAGSDHWSGGARDVDFFDLKGVAEQLAAVIGAGVEFAPITEPFLVPGQAASISSRGQRVGIVGQLTAQVADSRGLPRQDRVVVLELDLDALESMRSRADEPIRPLPRHPAVVRDVSIVVPDALPAEIIRGTMQAAGESAKAPLVGIAFFDLYQGAGVPAGSVSLSVRLTFQAADRTLTDADVQQSVDTILRALADQHGAKQR